MTALSFVFAPNVGLACVSLYKQEYSTKLTDVTDQGAKLEITLSSTPNGGGETKKEVSTIDVSDFYIVTASLAKLVQENPGNEKLEKAFKYSVNRFVKNIRDGGVFHKEFFGALSGVSSQGLKAKYEQGYRNARLSTEGVQSALSGGNFKGAADLFLGSVANDWSKVWKFAYMDDKGKEHNYFSLFVPTTSRAVGGCNIGASQDLAGMDAIFKKGQDSGFGSTDLNGFSLGGSTE